MGLNKKMTLSGLLILAVLFGGVVFLSTIIEKQQERIVSLKESAFLLKETWTPLRFKVVDRRPDEFTLQIKLYNQKGPDAGESGLIAEAEWTLPGQELFVDFTTLQVGEDLYLSFPHALFTDLLPPAQGKLLHDLYDDHGFPAVFGGQGMSDEEKEPLIKVFQAVKKGELISSRHFGNAVHDMKQLKSFREGYVYRVDCRRKGGIEVREE